jgi:hypothetical protein
VPGKPHHYEHTRDKNADGSPVKKYAPPVPDCPQHPNVWDQWREYMKAHGIDPTI